MTPDVTWALNWYMTRRHVDVDGHALCSDYTKTWPDGWHSDGHTIPAADSLDALAVSLCRLCDRKLAKGRTA